MNYQRIYEQLTAKDMIADYTEKHHIIPRCMGGTNHKSNLVNLTPEAHYVAHQLLVKIYPDNHKLIFAVHMMNNGRSTNKLYGWLRRKHATVVSKSNKGKVAPNKGKPHSEETKAKISESNKGRPSKIKGNKSKPHSEETKAKISESNKGRPSKIKGIPKTDETKAKLKIAGKRTVVCPHCKKEGSISQMKRYHLNTCKQNGLPGQTRTEQPSP